MNNRTNHILLTALVLAAAAPGVIALLTSAVTPDTFATPARASGSSEVIMMKCSTPSSGFEVKAYTRSTTAPDKKSNNCAEALSKVLESGFTIRDTGYDQEGAVVIITLTR
jgi:hypothetical protein